MGAIQSNVSNSDLKRSNVKLQAQQVSAFNGNAIKWRTWKKRTKAAIGTAGMLETLESSVYSKEHPMENETIFHLLQVATADGNAAHLVDSYEDTKDGHGAFKELVTWYEGDELTTETAEDIRSKLDKLALNNRNTASEYINFFQLYTKQLKDIGEEYTESKTVQIFLSQISDIDYDNTREFCIENKCKLTDCIELIRGKERRLERERSNSKSRTISVRRNINSNADELKDLTSYINDSGYYSIPREAWNNLSLLAREEVKKYNGTLRKSRKSDGKYSHTDNGNKAVTTRRSSSVSESDDNPSPEKKLRTVQFKDGDADDETSFTESNEKVIKQRRGDILSFQVKDK